MTTRARLRVLHVPLHVHVATCESTVPVQPDEWIQAHLVAAQSVVQAHGIALSMVSSGFAPSSCDLLTRADRDTTAPFVVHGRTVNVFVMNRVRDLDVPDYDLMGVHWRYGGDNRAFKRARWIFLTSRAQPPVLAHELCHFFGLPHDPAGGNLMTPGPSAPAWRTDHPPKPFAPVLTAAQAVKLRAGIERWQQ